MLKPAVLASLSLVACGDNLTPQEAPTPTSDDIAKRCAPQAMRSDLAWYGTNRETLTGWLDANGCAAEGYDRHERPVALFDWDNTVLKNDVGDAVTFYLIANDKVLQPPGGNWKRVNRYMTDAGAAALTAACGTDVAPGYPLPTSTNLACADELLAMYIDNKTRAGATAFAGHNFRRMEPTYAFTVQLLAGYTHKEVGEMTAAATAPMLAAPIGTTQVVGTRTLNGWLRIYEQTADSSPRRSRAATTSG
jgi:hypothetical protein